MFLKCSHYASLSGDLDRRDDVAGVPVYALVVGIDPCGRNFKNSVIQCPNIDT
jgi:hypothetical protein